MGSVFAKKSLKQPVVTEQDRAVLQLKQQRDRLNQNRQRIEIQLERERQVAKQLLQNGQKERALLLLRKKKMLESQLEKSERILEKVEQLTHELEFAVVQRDVVNSLRQGTDALKKMNELMKLEDIEKLMDENREAIQYQNEISSILAGGLTREDEEDVEAELEELIQADDENQINRLPNVPEHYEHERIRKPVVSPTKTKQRVLADAD